MLEEVAIRPRSGLLLLSGLDPSREDREHHELKIKDIKEILEINPEIIIIGTGNSGYLEVPSELKDLIRMRRINLVIDKNTNAISQYNKALIQQKRIGAIFHATC